MEVLISTQNRIKSKKGQNDNGLILGRVSINTRTRPSTRTRLGTYLAVVFTATELALFLERLYEIWQKMRFALNVNRICDIVF